MSLARGLVVAALLVVAACASPNLSGAQNSLPQAKFAPSSAAPRVTRNWEFVNGTTGRIAYHTRASNCMRRNPPVLKDIAPSKTIKAEVETNESCCRCSHETSWFVERFEAPDGHYRDVGFDWKGSFRDGWDISNRGSNSNLYYCERGTNVNISGTLIRGNKCPR